MNSPANAAAWNLWFQEGLRFHQTGRVDEAEALYQRVLAVQRQHFDSLHLLGVCRHQRGDFAAAQKHLRAALKLRPDVAAVHLSYGNVLRELRQLPGAVESYTRAARLEPRMGLAHYNLGTAFEELGRPAEALASYDRALALQADAAALAGRGNCLQALGRVAEAQAAYEGAIAQDPRCVDAHANLGALLMAQGRYEQALSCVERALSLHASHPGALLNHATLLTELGRPAESLQSLEALRGTGRADPEVLFQQARALASLRRTRESFALLDAVLAIDPAHWGARFEMAGGLIVTGRLEEAQALLDALLAERPGDLPTIFNRGLLAFAQGDLGRARHHLDTVLTAAPNTRLGRFNLSQLDLLEGDFTSGWERYETRWEDPALRVHQGKFAQSIWLGKDDISQQTLLVHAEQGAGDTLHFCRYVSLLCGRAAGIVFEVPGPLYGLMRRSMPPQVAVVVAGQPLPHFDRHCPLLSLPLAFGTVAATIPAPVPYLAADPERIALWRNRLGDDARLRVGLVWSGNPGHAQDHARSIALMRLLPLLRSATADPELAGIEFLALQNDLRVGDRAALAQAPALQYFGEAIQDFDDVAALAALCDLVIAVDTAAAHLAGAMGKPLWVLLAHVPDWRWMLERSDSPWYPSARLFRQEQRGAWEPVLERVLGALAKGHGSRDGAGPAPARDPGLPPGSADGSRDLDPPTSAHINFFCQFNHTGVGRHCENAYFAMMRNRSDGLALEYVNNGRDDSLRRMIARAQEEHDVTLYFWRHAPALVRQMPGRQVLWWFFESDRLPQKWLDDLQPYDQIWAPSTWARDVLLAHRVDAQRVRVVESGVNVRVYQPGPGQPHEGFIFLSVGKYEKRKSIDELIEAFVAEFPARNHSDVQLWLKADFPLFPDRVKQLAARWAHDARIRVISGIFSDEQMAQLYRAADAFVFPSKAEGFGLPLLEAIACGVPAIATRYSAQSVFLDHLPGLYAAVDYELAPIVDADYQQFYAAEYGNLDFGNWALPSVGSIRRAMREVYEQPQAWRARALQASEIVRDAFSWDAIGRKALDEIGNLQPFGPKGPTPLAAR